MIAYYLQFHLSTSTKHTNANESITLMLETPPTAAQECLAIEIEAILDKIPMGRKCNGTWLILKVSPLPSETWAGSMGPRTDSFRQFFLYSPGTGNLAILSIHSENAHGKPTMCQAPGTQREPKSLSALWNLWSSDKTSMVSNRMNYESSGKLWEQRWWRTVREASPRKRCWNWALSTN